MIKPVMYLQTSPNQFHWQLSTENLSKTSSNDSQLSKYIKLQCSFCKKWFLNNDTMINHLRSHSSHSIFPDEAFFFSPEDQQIETTSTTDTLLECGLCNQTFTYKFCLERHLESHSAQNLSDVCACCGENQDDNTTPCRICQVKCKGKSSRSYDERMKKSRTSTVKPFQCTLCPMSFSQRTPLKNHIMTHSDERPFACRFCDKTYKRNSELTRHTMVHTGERPYECKECLMTFREKTKLNYHMKVHTGEKPFECHFCHKACARKCDLTSHLLTHTGGRYDCEICEKFFTRKSDLKRHTLVHTGEKPFACDFCDMAFRERSRLNAHLLLHTGDKSHSCHICGKGFNDRLGLRKHMTGHAGKKPYQCHVCRKSFMMKSTLISHMQAHDRCYDCGHCQKSFKDEGALRIHELVHAKDKEEGVKNKKRQRSDFEDLIEEQL